MELKMYRINHQTKKMKESYCPLYAYHSSINYLVCKCRLVAGK